MTATMTKDGKASTLKKTFSRETSINISIKSDPAIVWALLTNAADYPRWNKTIISIDGRIAPGEAIRLKSALDPSRVFKLKVKEAEPERRLIWGDAIGNRVYTITKTGIGTLDFTMSEKIGGPLFPFFAGMIPSFDASFEQFAADLKKESELIYNSKN